MLYLYLEHILKMVKEVKPKKVVTKKPRTDKRKNIWKVAEVLVKNPNKTEREIAKETWLWAWTVNRAKAELEQSGAKDTTIAYIVGSAKTRLQRISALKDRYVDQLDLAEEIGNREIDMANKLWQEDMKLVTVLWWNVTDENWWLISIQDLTFDSMNGTNSAW